MFQKSNYFWSIIAVSLFSGCGSIDEPTPYGPIPTAAQLNWHEMEMYCLIHFTPTTFQGKEWGYGDAPADLFNPKHFDADQIAKAAKSAGFNGLISVAKHHDGYCLWPTETTDYNISQSPWRDGKGDMVKEFMRATREQGMQFGVYVSAWDRNHPEYGNDVYAAVYREQLRELYTNYGKLFTSWHDGANGGDGYYGGADEMRNINREIYYGWEDHIWPMIREMQPTAVAFSDVGPDIRWVGNEKGIAPATSWATFTPEGPDGGKAAPGHVNGVFLGSGQRDGKFWIPAECDVPLRPGWFYHAAQDHLVKTPAQLFDIYLQSVGRGAALNLGLAPMPEGILHPADVSSLQAFGEKVSRTFEKNLAEGATFNASNIRNRQEAHFGPGNLLDADRYSYWATDDGITSPELIVDLPAERTFNLIRLRENIKLGQRLDSVWVDIWKEEEWSPLAMATSIGSNRIIPLSVPATAKRLRLRLFAPVAVALSDFGLFEEVKVEGETVPVEEKQGIKRLDWIIIDQGTSGGDPILAFDGRKETFWLTENSALPQHITVDMRRVQAITGFTYLPPQGGRTTGLINRYTFEASADGIAWEKQSEGEFANIAANPIAQHITFGKPIQARYFRFTAVGVVGAPDHSAAVSMAEFEVYSD